MTADSGSSRPRQTLATCAVLALAVVVLLKPASGQTLADEPLRQGATPVFAVDVPNPTADKPQSKLWFAQGRWWACLPARDGNQIWKRSSAGWVRGDTLDPPLSGIHGHGDVYAECDQVQIVLVSQQTLTVATLCYDRRQDGYVRSRRHTMWLVPANQSVETATITRDRTGRLWVAYCAGNSVWVRASRDTCGACWTEPIEIGGGTHDDDICTITRLPCGVGVIWSNQNSDSVLFRFHRDGCSPYAWNWEETVAQGGKTADDHLNTAVAEDGTLYVATKTSLDTLGQPIFSLRVRSPRGCWRSHDYLALSADARPSRPIVLLSQCPPRLVLCHSVRGAGPASSIDCLVSPRPGLELHDATMEVIPAAKGLNNVTGCKSFLPRNAPAIVLASDAEGRVYEGTIEVGR